VKDATGQCEAAQSLPHQSSTFQLEAIRREEAEPRLNMDEWNGAGYVGDSRVNEGGIKNWERSRQGVSMS
jgi:hypothetical protein